MVMELLDDIIKTQTEIAIVLTRVNCMDVPDELEDIAVNAHRHLDLAYNQLENLYWEVEANE